MRREGKVGVDIRDGLISLTQISDDHFIQKQTYKTNKQTNSIHKPSPCTRAKYPPP